MKETIKLRLHGEDSIEIGSMIKTLTTLNTIATETSVGLPEDQKAILLFKSATPGNSLDAVLEVINVGTQFLTAAGGLGLVIYNIMLLRKKTKGKTPKVESVDEDNKIVNLSIEGENNTIAVEQNIFNFYTDSPKIEIAINKLAKDLISEGRPGFTLNVNQQTDETVTNAIEFNRVDVENLSKRINTKEMIIKEPDITSEVGEFQLKSPQLKNSRAQWEFLDSDNNNIKVKITDEYFLNLLNNGSILFSGKTTLIAELVTINNSSYNTNIESIIERSINKVHKVIVLDQNDNETIIEL